MSSQEPKQLSRRERERLAHRREILDGAERVFARNGYRDATVEQIAQEAEFSVGTLYNFFASKEELYAEVIFGIATEFMEIFEAQVLSREDPEQAIAALIELRLKHFDQHRGFFRVFFEAAPGGRIDPARALPENCLALYDRYVDAVGKIFQRGAEIDRWEQMDPLYLTLCLEGILNAFVAYWSRWKPEAPLSVRVAKMKDAFLGRLKLRASDGAESRPPDAS